MILTIAHQFVALIVGWPLLADLSTFKQAGVPAPRSLHNQYRLKQQAVTLLAL